MIVALLLVNAVAGVFTLAGILIGKPSVGEAVELHVVLCAAVLAVSVAPNIVGALA